MQRAFPAPLAERAAPQPASRRRRPRTRDWAVRRLLAAADVVAVLVSIVVALSLAGRTGLGERILWGCAAIPLMLALFKVYDLYDRDLKRIGHSTVDDLPWLLHAALVGSLVMWAYSQVTPMGRLGLNEVLLLGGGLILIVAAARAAMRSLLLSIVGPERALLVGGGDAAQALVATLAAHPEYQLRVLGAIQLGSHPAPPADLGLAVLGSLHELPELASRHDIARVVLESSDLDRVVLEELLRTCRTLALKVSLLPGLSDVLGSAVEIDDVRGVTLLGLNPPWLTRSSRAIKRTMDVSIAIALLILTTPVMLVLALAIKLDSRGPILFVQERVGRGGRRFRLLKLRTMVEGAEQQRDDLLSQSSDPNWLKLEHDPRVTRVGRLLRRLSLDELPQVWNVLRGEMSMVGPRPLTLTEDSQIQGWARGRLDLTPGITGYWQVLGRTGIPFEEMVKLDYLYVVNWSLWQDVRLMLRTLPAVLHGRGAN